MMGRMHTPNIKVQIERNVKAAAKDDTNGNLIAMPLPRFERHLQ